jgi:hypothetical protein
MSNSHVESSVKFSLKIVKEMDEKGLWVPKIADFNRVPFHKKYGKYFKMVKMFDVSTLDYVKAAKALEDDILEKYKNDQETLLAYWRDDKVPDEYNYIQFIPKTLRPAWEVMHQLNQNKWCNYQVLKEKIPGFEDINVEIFAGYKATGPFTYNNKVHYIEMFLQGPTRKIDLFTREFRN